MHKNEWFLQMFGVKISSCDYSRMKAIRKEPKLKEPNSSTPKKVTFESQSSSDDARVTIQAQVTQLHKPQLSSPPDTTQSIENLAEAKEIYIQEEINAMKKEKKKFRVFTEIKKLQKEWNAYPMWAKQLYIEEIQTAN